MRRQLYPALGMILALTALTGLVYPLLITAIGQLAFHHQANGSVVSTGGREVGSLLIGQRFTGERYLHPRPSAAGDGYDAMKSSSSNLGPSNPALLKAVAERARAYRADNGLEPDAKVPVDAVTASGSGLDPEISIANARIQAVRVANERGLSADKVISVINGNTRGRTLGFLGEPGVNVLTANLALDNLR
jgi:K+-transporting ATPase ATPase C chain